MGDRGRWIVFSVALVLWLVFAVLAVVVLPANSEPVVEGSNPEPGVEGLVVTTANIKKDLGPTRARADLTKAATGSDVVLTQEMGHRRIDVPGWGRVQALGGVCAEVPVYYRRATVALVSWRTVVIQHGSWPGATRCVTVAKLRQGNRVFVVVNVHQAQHVEVGGHPRPGRAAVYARGMARLERIRANLAAPYLIGGDWNVDRRADARVRWHGFPRSYLSGLAVTRTGGTLGGRQVDYIWTGPAWHSPTYATRITDTFSDHDFVRARLVWVPWMC